MNHRGHRGRINTGMIWPVGRGGAIVCLFLLGFLCVVCGEKRSARTQTTDLALPQEKHLRNIRQLTFAGENAEAYFSSDGKKLIFQSTRNGRKINGSEEHTSDPQPCSG